MLYANDAVIACPDRAAKSAVVVVYAHDEVMAYDELIEEDAHDADAGAPPAFIENDEVNE